MSSIAGRCLAAVLGVATLGIASIASAAEKEPAPAHEDGGVAVKPRYLPALAKADESKPHLVLTPYGQANFALLYSDDGRENDAIPVDVNSSSSRLGLIARLNPRAKWAIGFQYEAGFDIPGSTTARATDEGRTRPFIDGDNEPFTRILHGWIEGPYGKITVGESLPVVANWIPNPGRTFATDQAGYFLVGGGFNPAVSNPTGSRERLVRPWSAFAAPMQWPLTVPVFLARYDSPSFAGVRVSASKAQNDIFDVGLRYRGRISRVAVDVSFAYHDNEAPRFDAATPSFPEFEETFVGGIGVRDAPTGLFAAFGGNYRMFDGSDRNDFDGDGNLRPDDFSVWGQIGLRRNLFGIGDTVLYGVVGYGRDRGEGRLAPGAVGSRWLETRVTMAGVNVIQELDIAKRIGTRLELYAGYRQWRGRFLRTASAIDPTPFDEEVEPLHIVASGFRLRF